MFAGAKRFNVVQCGRRWGKSTFGEVLIAQPALAGLPVAWFAPTYKYLLPAWRDIDKMLAPVIRRRDTMERRLELTTGGSVDFWTMDSPDPGRGRKYARVVIDEAGIVRDLLPTWNSAIRPTTTDLRGDAWFLGTPKGRREFHQLFAKGEQGDDGWASFRGKTVDNPAIDPLEVAEARVDMEKAGLLQVFLQEYEGIPADDGGNPFGMAAIAACAGMPFPVGKPVVFGVDLGKSQDWTVIIGLDDAGNVVVCDRWQAVPWPETRARILKTIGSVPALIDSTGLGDPVVDELQRERSGCIEGFKFSQSSKQQLMEGLVSGIQSTSIRFDNATLRNELEAFEYEYHKTGVRYSAPTGLHDDCVCALALAWRHKTMRPTTRIYTHQPKPIVTMTFAERRAADPNYGFGDDE